MNSTENTIFDYYAPKGELKGIVSIPHSGLNIPNEFITHLSENIKDLRQDVDFAVHELIDINALQENGIAVLKSNIIRTAIDLNRSRDLCLLNWKSNSHGVKIVNSTPGHNESELLIESYYSPYYEMLKTLIDELSSIKETPSIVDLHSMPSTPTEYHFKVNPNQSKDRPDFCISDISGISCQKEYIDYVCNDLTKSYDEVTQNSPYFGGHITRHIHKMYPKVNNIQIEIKRSIYMDEATQTLIPVKSERLKPILTQTLLNLFNQFE